MVRIPTLIPEGVADLIKRGFRGSWLDVLWKLLVLVVAIGALVALAAVGGGYTVLAGALAFIVLSEVLGDDIRTVVSDIWNRNFWVFRT